LLTEPNAQRALGDATASQATLVKDIATVPFPASSSCPELRHMLGVLPSGVALMVANTADDGCELWRSDGTPEGTQLLKDIWPGHADGILDTSRLMIGRSLLFTADDGGGNALWRSDGTAAGTQRVKRLCVGECHERVIKFHALGEQALMVSYNTLSGSSLTLWVSDGTAAGTRQIDTVVLHDTAFATFRGKAYFQCSLPGQDDNVELCVTDGTVAGTTMHAEIRPGPQGGMIGGLHALSSGVIFVANDGEHGSELWITDGTVPRLLKDINPGVDGSGIDAITPLIVAQKFPPFQRVDVVLFSALDVNSGRELWRTDGSSDGTRMVGDFTPGPVSSSPEFIDTSGTSALITVNTTFYGREPVVVRSNGTVLSALHDVRPGFASSAAKRIGAFGDGFYFSANDGVAGTEIWKAPLNGAAATLVKDLTPGPTGTQFTQSDRAVAMGDRLFFVAQTDALGNELYVSDGTSAGTSLVADINTGPASGLLGDMKLTVLNNQILFRANSGAAGNELWRTDGSAAGTRLLKNIAIETSSIDVRGAIHALPDGRVLLYGCPGIVLVGVPPCNLYVTRGTDATTERLAPIGKAFLSPNSVAQLENTTLFLANNFSREEPGVWRSDGSSAGTGPLDNVPPLAAPEGGLGPIIGPVRIGDAAYFEYRDDPGRTLFRTDGVTTIKHVAPAVFSLELGGEVNGAYVSVDVVNRKIYRSDLTLSPTIELLEWPPIPARQTEAWLMPAGPDRLFFVLDNGRQGFGPRDQNVPFELWVTDGTVSGTRLVKLFKRLGKHSAALDGVLYFGADDSGLDIELWKSDGTAAGTTRVRDIAPGPTASNPGELSVYGGALYFSAKGADERRLLYVSDGTADGTVPVREDADAPQLPVSLRATRDGLFFAAADAAHGNELWRSDGTAAGTQLVTDIATGPSNSNPVELVDAGDKLYFGAYRADLGQELWVVSLAPAAPLTPTPVTVRATRTPAATVLAGTPSAGTRKVFLPLSSR
jgi:ELWxxDGT repeat protein